MSERRILTDEMEKFLEELRDTGTMNMMGAAPTLEFEFDLSRQDAKSALKEWMFNE